MLFGSRPAYPFPSSVPVLASTLHDSSFKRAGVPAQFAQDNLWSVFQSPVTIQMPKESIDPPDNDEIASESGSSKPDTAEKQYRMSSYTLSEKDLEIFGAKAANIEEKHKQVKVSGE